MEITRVEDNSTEYQGWGAWAKKFKPIKNKFSNDPDYEMFETYGEEFEFVKGQDFTHVWTWVDGDMSSLLVPGIAYVNRLGYYVTEVPWENDMDSVLLSVEKECVCYSEEGYEFTLSNGEEITQDGDPNCPECEGYGLVTEYL